LSKFSLEGFFKKGNLLYAGSHKMIHFTSI